MLAPWFLVGLFAIGLPWWLHRLARSETTPQAFPSLMLLESSDLRDTRKRQLRYLALLALRIALLVAIVLAFVQPQWFTKVPEALANQARMHVIVLDTSLSMKAGTRWQQAKEHATKLIDAARAGDQLLLISAAGRKVQVLAGPVAGIERARVRAALEDLTPSLDRLDYGLAMTSVKTWRTEEQLPMELHLIGDLQASGSPLRFADLEPPPGARLHLHAVADAAAPNAAITRVALSNGEKRMLSVNMNAYGGTPTGTLVLNVDDREFGKQAVQWQADGTAVANFSDLKLTPGAHRIEAQLQIDDALSDDNRYYAVIEHADPRVLLIARNPQADEVLYLAAAIESLSAPRLTVSRTMPEQLSSLTLADYAAIVIADSGVLSEDAAQRLAKHAGAGGALFVTLGPQALRTGADPITGLKVRELGGNAVRIGAVDDSHPILREPEAWRGVRFFKRMQITPAESDRSLLRFEDGAPLLLERSLDAGRVLLMAAPLDREWNDLAVHPLFVRFIAETARYLAGNDASTASTIVGGNVATGVAAGAAGQVFDPQGKRVSSLAGSENASRLSPDQIGFYEVRSANHSRFIAANVDTRESNLAPLAAEVVQKWQALEKPAVATTTNAAAVQYRRELGPLLLILVALLALAELLVANYRLQVVRDA
jgi:hypothetical protein